VLAKRSGRKGGGGDGVHMRGKPPTRSILCSLLALALAGSIPLHPSPALAAPALRIAGGEPSPTPAAAAPPASVLPSAAAIVKNVGEGGTDANRQFCGGSLVAPHVVVTAAHCLLDRDAMSLQVVTGRSNLLDPGGQRLDVAAALTYPFFDSRTLSGDVAVLRLAAASNQTPVPLGGPPGQWQPAEIAGWGSATEGGQASAELRFAAISILPDKACSRGSAYGFAFYRSTMICAGTLDGSADACTGDSGGPLLVDGALVGLVGWGRGCASPRYPGVYTRLSNPAIGSWTQAAIAALEAGQVAGSEPRTVVRSRGPRRQRRRAVLRLDAPGQPWAGFECAVKRQFRVCLNPVRARLPRRGTHRLRVRAVNLFGAVDPSPANVRLIAGHPARATG